MAGWTGAGWTMWAPLALGLAASAATLAGGLLALRVARRAVPVLALAAGVVLGVALFDLLPEALDLRAAAGDGAAPATGWMALGVGGYLLLDRLPGGRGPGRRAAWRAHLGPATLTLHSLADGLGIGLSFNVSPAVGGVVALAVLTHDLADGVNVVGLCLAAERDRAARGWLLVNAAAPLAGTALGLALRVPAAALGAAMGVFAGGFLYLGAGELLPRSHALDPRPRTTFASLAGIAFAFAVAQLAR